MSEITLFQQFEHPKVLEEKNVNYSRKKNKNKMNEEYRESYLSIAQVT